MELEIQKYLRSGKSLGDLHKDHFISSSVSKQFPNLVLLWNALYKERW